MWKCIFLSLARATFEQFGRSHLILPVLKQFQVLQQAICDSSDRIFDKICVTQNNCYSAVLYLESRMVTYKPINGAKLAHPKFADPDFSIRKLAGCLVTTSNGIYVNLQSQKIHNNQWLTNFLPTNFNACDHFDNVFDIESGLKVIRKISLVKLVSLHRLECASWTHASSCDLT